MLYLQDSIITISAATAVCIPTLLFGFHQLVMAYRESGQKRINAIFGCLVGFMMCGGFFIGVVMENLLLPSLPTISEQLPYYQWSFVLISFASFFLLYWSVLVGAPEVFTRWKRRWMPMRIINMHA